MIVHVKLLLAADFADLHSPREFEEKVVIGVNRTDKGRQLLGLPALVFYAK